MPTTLLNRAFGCRDYRYRSTRYEVGAVIFCVEPKERMLVCPFCGSKEVVRKGRRTRRVRSVPIGRKTVWLDVSIPRLDCRKCSKRFEVFPPLLTAHEATPRAWRTT